MKVQCEWLNKKISINNNSLQKIEFKNRQVCASLLTRSMEGIDF